MIILIPGFAESESDSSCLPMHQALVKQLASQYPDIKIVVCAFHYPFRRATYELCGAVIKCFGGRNRTGLRKWFLKKRILRYLINNFNSDNSCAVLSFWYGDCAETGESFSRHTGVRHFCWLMGQDAKATNSFPMRLKIAGERLIVLSDSLQEEFLRNHAVRPETVIPPGLAPTRRNLSPPRDIDILAVGSLIKLKQFHIVIEIAAELVKQFPTLKVVIIGDGPQLQSLSTLLKEKGLESSVSLQGKVSHEEVIATMQRSKVLLHPSEYEGFSGVCQEALASGCDVISFCKPMRDNIAGWHVVNDMNEMATVAIGQLSSPPDVPEDRNPYRIESTATMLMNLLLGK